MTDVFADTFYWIALANADDSSHQAAAIAHSVLEDPTVRVCEQSRETFLSGLRLYSARADKGYSLTDCVAMATMAREDLQEVLSNDRHFEQEGYIRLF